MYEVGQEFAVAFLFLSLKDPGHVPGVWWVSSSPGGLAGAEAVLVAVGQVMVLSFHQDTNQILNSIKTKSTL